uniref:Uncharacterized protein n=1 Tax=Panagrolaimus sp. ES5 TaxID=591445 RepID=A0AC34F4U3_9BILA
MFKPYDQQKFLKISQNIDCVGCIHIDPDNDNDINIGIIDMKTSKVFELIQYARNYSKRFLDDIPTIFSNFKAMIVNLYEMQNIFVYPGFKNDIEFCKAIKDKLNSINIPSYFLSHDDSLTGALIVASKIDFKFGEKICSIFIYEDNIAIQEMEFTKNGIKITAVGQYTIQQYANSEVVRNEIVGAKKFDHTLLCSKSPGMPLMKLLKEQVFKADKPKIFENDIINNTLLFVVETAKWLLDKSYTKFYILPLCDRVYKICKNDETILEVMLDEALPLLKSIIVDDSSLKYTFSYRKQNEVDFDVIKELKFNKIFGKHKITVTVDEENFPNCCVNAVVPKNVHNLPQNLDKQLSSKVPVIGFHDQSSVILVNKNDENLYKFLDSWNVMNGKELFMSFDEEKYKYFEKAAAVFKTKPSFVVYDLIKIMSMPSDEIKVDKKWKFTFSEDSENPLLLEFDTFSGMRRAATPVFLIKLLLKKHLKAIKKETGEMPKELAFCFFDKFGDSEAKNRVEKGFKEVCKQLKIDFSFVDL